MPFQDETEQPKKEEGEEEESVQKVEEIDEKGDVEKEDILIDISFHMQVLTVHCCSLLYSTFGHGNM